MVDFYTKNMKKMIYKLSLLLGITATGFAFEGCSNDNTSDLQLDGDCWLTEFSLDNYEGVIDNTDMTVTVGIPLDYDESAMEVTAIGVSEGAEASMKEGDIVDFSFPQAVQVINGDAFLEYTVSVKHDEARITAFTLNDSYIGIINETSHTILVRVPTTVDITNMVPDITTTEGAEVSPASGQAVDFTEPVEFTVTYNTATTVYTVTVEQSDSPGAVYVGLASSMDQLNPEEYEAASWMLQNVANSQYISFEDVRTDQIDLSECKVMWWHFHIDGGVDNMDKFDAAAPDAVNAVVKMKEFYDNGGSLLLTRFATYYAVKMGATSDGNYPNNCWGQSEESCEITTAPWSFYVDDNADHPIYSGIVSTIDGRNGVYTCDTGYRITNSTAQWHLGSDWGGYPSLEDWENNHGGTSLGYGSDGAVVVWEYPENTAGGRILCIGSGCYDWYSYGVDVSTDQYHENVAAMTQNAINYLTGE